MVKKFNHENLNIIVIKKANKLTIKEKETVMLNTNANINLTSENIFNNTVYFLHRYYPVKHFDWRSLDQDSVEFRTNLFKFKDGTNQSVTRMFANEVISAIQCIAPDFNNLDYAFLAMPASSENRTTARYSLLLEILKQEFPQVSFVNDYVTFNGERQAKHLASTSINDQSNHFNIKGGVSGKTVIIFDDITTTGKSMEMMDSLLKRMGAKKCILLSLGRTVDYRKL